ncbi:hypothetical protein DIPPA_32153 [Diplonema papillatum]|nr:hypothetical protein DIPPA_32153 [Diplonema papillatum]
MIVTTTAVPECAGISGCVKSATVTDTVFCRMSGLRVTWQNVRRFRIVFTSSDGTGFDTQINISDGDSHRMTCTLGNGSS